MGNVLNQQKVVRMVIPALYRAYIFTSAPCLLMSVMSTKVILNRTPSPQAKGATLMLELRATLALSSILSEKIEAM